MKGLKKLYCSETLGFSAKVPINDDDDEFDDERKVIKIFSLIN